MTLPNEGEILAPQDLGIRRSLSIRDAIIVADAHTGRIALWNTAAESIFGYSRAEAQGMSVEELILITSRHATGRAWLVTAKRVTVAISIPIRCWTYPLYPRPAKIRVELTLSPIEPVARAAVEGRLVLAIVRDAITVIKPRRIARERGTLRARCRSHQRGDLGQRPFG